MQEQKQHDLPDSFVSRLTGIRPEEFKAVAWSLIYIVTLFLAYYVLRPIRDELGVAGGVSNLPWLFTGTLLAMLVATPLFGYAVRRFSRKRFIAISYRFFAVNLITFAILLATGSEEQQVWIGRAFFIWVSVFNLFVVSIFWSFVTDIFNSGQGKRLFGMLAAGATVGGLLGSALTSGLVAHIGRVWLIVVSIGMLELAVSPPPDWLGSRSHIRKRQTETRQKSLWAVAFLPAWSTPSARRTCSASLASS